MASLNIPERHLEGLIKFYSLPDKTVENIIANLQEISVNLDPDKAMKEVVASVTGFNPTDTNLITQAINSLYFLRVSSNKPLEEILEHLAISLRENTREEITFSDEEIEKFKTNLNEILSVENLELSFKAIYLKFEQDNLYSKANVITQITPVFSKNIDENPRAALIFNQLGITYFQHGESRELYLRMDEEEIEELIESLERAKKKTESLRRFLESTDVQYLENI